MPSVLPDGQPVPPDGSLPSGVGSVDRPLGLYLHVPFCRTRCGYCDFNTYTGLEELATDFADVAAREIRLAAAVLGDRRPVSTVFLGGGTPTLLPPADLVRLLRTVESELGLEPGAEVTTEANPDSVDLASLTALREGGFTRISFGMQSAVPHVLSALERTHSPGSVERAVHAAREAGFASISVDLIYGAPGESDADWQTSLDAALGTGPTHVSAYALIVEEGTRLARQVARGEAAPADDDTLADRYLMAEEALGPLGWYEVSNWGEPCRHNLGYWLGHDWWGVGPGAHSHVDGVRWWNVRHPTAYAGRLMAGRSPGQGREVLGAAQRRAERVLLELRLREGLPLEVLTQRGRDVARGHVVAGLLDPDAHGEGRAALTLRGRLLADAVVRDLA